MKLYELIKAVDVTQVCGNDDVEITGICADSKKVREGNLFVCFAGGKHDSHEYIAEAINNGAVAVV
jgi:UDP-N-acetylmuramoyl-L-alanyl-D-glutamate--2,6-diaminopimelate ligase